MNERSIDSAGDDPEPTNTQVSSYVAFIQQIELRDLWLKSCRITNSTSGVPPSGADVEVSEFSKWEPSTQGFNVFHRYVIVYSRGAKRLGRIEVEFGVEYASEIGMDDSIFEVFEEHNLPLNTWPYLREFISSAVGRMNWPPFTLPSRKFISDVVVMDEVDNSDS